MSRETEQEAFINGVAVGISLHQQRVLAAHKRNEVLIIGDELFYLQSGRERLEEYLEKICE